MNKDRFIEQSVEYALGALEGNELREFESYLRTASEEERQMLSELTATASLLPLALDRQSPSPEVKEQLMQRVRLSALAQDSVARRTKAPERTTGRNWIPWGVGAAIAMVAVFSIFVMNLLSTISDQNRILMSLEDERAEMQTRLVALQDELTRKTEHLRVLSARQIHVSLMDGLSVNPVGYGKIIWDPEKGTAILQVANLPGVAPDKDYQLWVIRDKTPMSAGVFAVQDTSSNFFKIENLAVTNPKEIAAFAVTLEPKGGVPQPTGDMYMLGSPRSTP